MYSTILYLFSILFTLFYSILSSLLYFILHQGYIVNHFYPVWKADSSGTPRPHHLIGPTNMTAMRLVELVPFLPE